MTHTNHTINPLYAARMARTAHQPSARRQNVPVYARLPLAPVNASPVPHLTSLYHFHRAGEYGDRSYPGNCGGKLTDIIRFSHGASSSRKIYRSSFIPGLHDVCMVFEKA